MSKITWIKVDEYKADRMAIFIDNKFCTSIRKRTFSGMNLNEGDEITCEELKEKENFFWKQAYGKKSWEREKVRLEKVKELVLSISSNLVIKETGFGAGKTEFLAEHPDESGSPDLTVYKDKMEIMFIEVTGTEFKRASDYWVRPDKIKYFQNHPEKNIWIILYFNSLEQFIFIRPNSDQQYEYSEEIINEATEHFVKFNDDSSEVKNQEQFRDALLLVSKL